MTLAAFGGSPFSTTVNFWLEQDNQRFDLSHMAPGVLRSPYPIAVMPGEAELVTVIDGREQRQSVVLWGISGESTTIQYHPKDLVPF